MPPMHVTLKAGVINNYLHVFCPGFIHFSMQKIHWQGFFKDFSWPFLEIDLKDFFINDNLP